ncbi:MAG TPA: Lrp/AsnC family transcriptional regulator [Deltaproteobacteria bacterium]|nr:Lrp/AsnC family transcriptional regulator [Deltaproteobacteria bacterium]
MCCDPDMDIALDDIDTRLLAMAEADLDVRERPFDVWAERLGISADEVVRRLAALRDAGVIRGFKAVLRHEAAGVRANAMVAWAVPGNRVEEAGRVMASFDGVSHCYERTGFEPYTVFSMIHGASRQEVGKTVDMIACRIHVNDYRIYWSVRELKKTSLRYFGGGLGNEE